MLEKIQSLDSIMAIRDEGQRQFHYEHFKQKNIKVFSNYRYITAEELIRIKDPEAMKRHSIKQLVHHLAESVYNKVLVEEKDTRHGRKFSIEISIIADYK